MPHVIILSCVCECNLFYYYNFIFFYNFTALTVDKNVYSASKVIIALPCKVLIINLLG